MAVGASGETEMSPRGTSVGGAGTGDGLGTHCDEAVRIVEGATGMCVDDGLRSEVDGVRKIGESGGGGGEGEGREGGGGQGRK